jgi:UDP-N-acetylglucosamine pyrophosphorylase
MSTVAEIREYLLLLGWSEKQLQSQRPWNDFEKLEKLANEKGGTLRDTAAVHAALAAELAKAATAARQEREAKFRPLSEKEERRMRLAFDHFDEDASGELDRAEFRRAMMDCGMMPLGFEVESLFREADEDGSGLVDYDEYKRFVQLYKSKQDCCTVVSEKIMDVLSPEPEYMKTAFAAFRWKMRQRGCNTAAISAFKYNYEKLVSRANLMVPEADIAPVAELRHADALSAEDPALLRLTVVLKLNGGLGTGMGLETAKSLLALNERGDTFLDFIARQVMAVRSHSSEHSSLAFMLMNSFATSEDTMKHLSKYSDLATRGLPLEFLQNSAPKVLASDLSPASWPDDEAKEWCPPGHGDLYPALVGSGTLEKLRAQGYRYMFVSNSDNLGATLDLKLLTWFARSAAPFAMEVCERTEADKKGGHLAKSVATGELLLRESAQCAAEDEAAFQDVTQHKFFNTNNLWVDLDALHAAAQQHAGGALPLPVMKNGKTVDPRDKASPKVLQLETAMGAAIQCFPGAQAICVPRSRFAPVKTTGDLLALMSDAYEVTRDFRMVLKPSRNGVPPVVKLDDLYKFVDNMKALIPDGAPSLIQCARLEVKGAMVFQEGVVFVGDVKVVNKSSSLKTLGKGTYVDDTIEL